MAESEKELGKRLFGYMTETIGKMAEGKEFTADVTRKLKAGDIEGIRTFMLVAEGIVKSGRVDKREGVLKWVGTAFPLLPKDDQEILLATLVDCIIAKGLVKAVLGEE